MIAFPNAKINLGLNILRKRNDGYHDIETLFYPVPLCDVLEIIEKPTGSDLPMFTNTGLSVDSPIEKNLCVKAYQLLKADFNLPDVVIHLHKVIPFGAGLGGGSANAAFTITLLNKLFTLGLSAHDMRKYVARLGSDCAFFIENKPAIAEGRGEILNPVGLSLSGYYILLVKPPIHVSTAEAYSGEKPAIPKQRIRDTYRMPIEAWKENIKNDFEEQIFKKYPHLKEIKEKLYKAGAVFASMSGSGSTLYGLFKNEPAIAPEFNDYFTWKAKLSN